MKRIWNPRGLEGENEMKILINNFPEELELSQRQELPGETLVEYVNDAGDRFRVSPSENGNGISVSVRRERGSDQMAVHPRYSNNIEIL